MYYVVMVKPSTIKADSNMYVVYKIIFVEFLFFPEVNTELCCSNNICCQGIRRMSAKLKRICLKTLLNDVSLLHFSIT